MFEPDLDLDPAVGLLRNCLPRTGQTGQRDPQTWCRVKSVTPVRADVSASRRENGWP